MTAEQWLVLAAPWIAFAAAWVLTEASYRLPCRMTEATDR